jgi:hypothetical protein
VLTDARLGRHLEPGARLEGLRQQLDIMPTVIELLGWRLSRGTLPGRSLLSPEGHGSVWFSCASAGQCMGMRTPRYKFVQEDWGELPLAFDLMRDPRERTDISGALPPATLRAVQRELWQHRGEIQARYRAAQQRREETTSTMTAWREPSEVAWPGEGR